MASSRMPDPVRSQRLRERCNRIFHDQSIPDAVGALEMLVADLIEGMPRITEAEALSAADAVATDVKAIIRERFAARKGGH